MAFDRTNQAHLDALLSEVTNDPLAVGYNPSGGTNPLLNLLNDAGSNPGGETTGETLTVGGLLDAVGSDPDAASVDAQFSDGLQFFLGRLLEQTLDTPIERYRSAIQAAMQTNNPIRAYLEAMTRPLSRAEVLFGAGTYISRDDWIAARDGGVV